MDGAVPWQLEAARWLGAATLLSGLFELVKTLLGDRYRQWRIRFFRKHHIVAGLNSRGFNLASDLLKNGERVVALDSNPDPPLLDRFRALGGMWIPHDASAKFNFDAVGMKDASTFTMVTPDDSLNLSVAYAIEDIDIINSDGSKLEVYAHVGEVSLRDLLDRNSFFDSSPKRSAVIRTFNTSANMARMLLHKYPLETAGFEDGAHTTDREVHLLLAEVSHEAIALLTQAARVGHYLGERKIHAHLVCEKAGQALDGFLSEYSSIKNCYASVTAHDVCGGSDFAIAAGKIISSDETTCFTVIPCFDPNPGHLATVLRIQEEIAEDRPYRMLLPHGLRDFLSSAVVRHPHLSKKVFWFPDDSQCCSRDSVFNEKLDLAAKAIHDTWLLETDRQIEAAEQAGEETKVDNLRSKPTYKTWDNLSEEQKRANRSQADHAPVKIRAAGLDPSDLSFEEWACWCSCHPDELEQLARVEHQRWAANLWIEGWAHDIQRDDSRKLHNNLVPYDDLDQPTKDYDVDAVKGLARFMRL